MICAPPLQYCIVLYLSIYLPVKFILSYAFVLLFSVLFVVAAWLLLFFLFVLGFACLFSFLFVCVCAAWFAGSWFPSQGLDLSLVGALSLGHWTAREFQAPGNINWQELSQRSQSRHQDLAPPNCLQNPVLDASCQTTSKTGTQPHPSSDRLPKVILSSQTPPNTQHDMALPIRGTRLSSTHQSTSTSPSNQEAYTSPWTNLTHQGADTINKRNYDPAACGKETTNTVS